MDTSRCGGSEQDGEYNLTIITVTQLQLQLLTILNTVQEWLLGYF